MKKLLPILIVAVILALSTSCKKDSTDETTSANTIGSDPSPMGTAGTTVSSSSVAIAGVSNCNASVTSLSDGISSYTGTATVTNATIKNILSNLPGITISGDIVTATGFKFKQTLEGIQSYVDISPGIIVKYSSNVGDTYPVGSTGRVRTVVSKSTTDDYGYGFFLIKVMKIEEPTPALKSLGVSKITYWANHRFGLVGVKFDFNDNTNATFPVYTSAENGK
jgi:hypothetical protein